MMRYFYSVFFVFFSFEILAQVPVFDKLELLYSQKHYKMVYRRSNRLLDIPDYDYSYLPELYKSLSMFQLSQDKRWSLRNPAVLDDALALFKQIKSNSDGMRIIEVHISELRNLYGDLSAFATEYKKRGLIKEYEKMNSVMRDLFSGIKDLEVVPIETDSESDLFLDAFAGQRDKLVLDARELIGIPYLWAGMDTNGFDCSGFTSYVMKQSGKELPRRAIDQFESSRKVKNKNAQKGDLVFFDGGSGVSHVGILISERGKPLVMIHASSSSGVIITDIEKSDYWLKRLKGFGTYFY